MADTGVAARGSSAGNGTIRHRWQNVNELNGFIDEITCPGEMRSCSKDRPRVAVHCTRKTMPTCDQSRFPALPLPASFYGGIHTKLPMNSRARNLRSVSKPPMKWLALNGGLSIDTKSVCVYPPTFNAFFHRWRINKIGGGGRVSDKTKWKNKTVKQRWRVLTLQQGN